MRVRGEGPVPSEIMFVGEGPGIDEDRTGRCFVGKTGKELNRFLDGDSLPLREDVFVDNLYRQYGGKKYVYTAEDLARDEPELIRNIKAVQPKIIVPLGWHSTRWFMGDVDMDDCQGIPWTVTPQKVGREVTVFPITHPAAGFYNPEMSPYVVDGFFQLSRFLNGEVEARVMFDDPYPNPVYEEVTDATHLRVVLRAVCRGTRVHVDTEGTPGHPWSLQFSFQLGTGYLIRAAHRDLLRLFAAHIRDVGAIIVYHNSLHDLAIDRALGIADLLADVQFDDTMVMAYLLQIVPQGLKPLGLRFANMRMRSYMDLLGGKQNQLAFDYAVGLFDIEQFDWEARCEDAFWTEIDKGRNIRVHPKVSKTPLHKAAERILRSKNPYKLWNDQIEDTRVAGYNRMGPMPEATLNHVPAGDAIEYGCRDADCTGRVRPELERRLDALELRPVYDLEIATYPLIDRMQKVGIRPDLPYFKKFSAELQDEIDIIQYRLGQWTGREDFNANSGDQVAEYLFDELGLEPLKMTESGRGSTNDKILGGLEHEHGNSFPVIGDIREYREVYKLKNTFCVTPDTRVLTSNLLWQSIGDISEGETLLGFDEHTRRCRGIDHHRHWRNSQVVSTQRLVAPCYRLTFSDGSTVVCTEDHKWLARSTSSFEKAVWVRTDEICMEDRPKNTRHPWEIIKLLDVWESRDDYDCGWLGGLLDGEGCLQRPKWSIRLNLAQNPGVVMDMALALLASDKFYPSVGVVRKNCRATMGRSRDVFHALGLYRPIRLLKKFRDIAQADNLPRANMSKTVSVVSREFVGEQEVVALETSTGTYVAEGLASHNCDRLPDFVRRWPYDDRIHSTFRTTRVITGRLSASDPNILALPKRGKFAKAFRRGFIADPGHVFGSWDLSQIELRILAHLSQDPLMLAIYRGEKRNTDGSLIDLHAQLAERIFGVKPADQDKSKHRLPAKAINFGIPMGMTNIGLTIELRKNGVMVTEDDAQRWLDETFALYKAVPNYMDQMKAEARRNGYIRCLSGRIRYIGGIRSSNERVRAEAERFAFSTPIQEGAQFVMKTAEAYIWKNIIQRRQKMGQWIEPIVQIHDDMVLELQSEQLAREVHPEMVYAMTKVFQGLSVPIETSGDLGPNWADMVEIVA